MTEKAIMTRMNVSLSVLQRDYVRERALELGCGTPGEFLRQLISRDQDARERRIEELLLDGLRSPSREIGPAEWAKLREDLRAKVRARKA